MCRNSVVNVVEIKKEYLYDSYVTVTTCLRPYGNQALRIKIPNFQGRRKQPLAAGAAISKGHTFFAPSNISCVTQCLLIFKNVSLSLIRNIFRLISYYFALWKVCMVSFFLSFLKFAVQEFSCQNV